MSKRRSPRSFVANPPIKRGTIGRSTESDTKPSSAESPGHPLLTLQRQLGNATVARLIAEGDERESGLREGTGLAHPKGRVSSDESASAGRDITREADASALQREVSKSFKDEVGRDQGSITLDAEAQLLRGSNQLMGTVKFPKGVQEFTAFNLNQKDFTNFHGTLRLNINASWNFRGAGPASKCIGTGLLSIDTPFRIPETKADSKTDDDAVKFKQPRLARQESSGTCAALDPQPEAKADSDDTGLSVEASPRVTYQEQDASQLGLSIPIPVSPSVQLQQQIAKTDAFGANFTVNLLVDKAKPPSPNPPVANKQLKRFAMTSEFGVNQRDPLPSELALLKMWWNGQAGLQPLPNDDARAAVRAGQTQVFVIGHASRTGSREYNLVLAKDRADHVAKILSADNLMGSGAKIASSSAGLDDAKEAGEAQSERFVIVVFEALVSDSQPAPSVPDNAPESAPAN